MMWSGALTHEQVNDIYNFMAANRSLVMGVPGWNSTMSLRAPFGLAFGLLQYDMVERFLLHFYSISAHGYTRGTLTTPQSSNLANRDEPTLPYASTGIHTVPIYLKWMLVFEGPETHTPGCLWLGKAVPRDWLVAGEVPLLVQNATTRYGRVSFSLAVAPSTNEAGGSTVHASVTLPPSFATVRRVGCGAILQWPSNFHHFWLTFGHFGSSLRIRAHAGAGKLSGATVGGNAWSSFDPAEETVDLSASQLTPSLIAAGLPSIVATYTAQLAANG